MFEYACRFGAKTTIPFLAERHFNGIFDRNSIFHFLLRAASGDKGLEFGQFLVAQPIYEVAQVVRQIRKDGHLSRVEHVATLNHNSHSQLSPKVYLRRVPVDSY